MKLINDGMLIDHITKLQVCLDGSAQYSARLPLPLQPLKHTAPVSG